MIELRKPEYGTRCNDCFSDKDVKEITIHNSNGQGIVIRLCAKCRGELIRLLLDDNMKKIDFNMITKIDDFIKRVESTAEEDFFTPRTFYHLSSSMFHEMCELLKEQEEHKTGKWEVKPANKEQGERDFIWWKCSECGQVIYSESEYDRKEFHKYCGRCGAKMT